MKWSSMQLFLVVCSLTMQRKIHVPLMITITLEQWAAWQKSDSVAEALGLAYLVTASSVTGVAVASCPQRDVRPETNEVGDFG